MSLVLTDNASSVIRSLNDNAELAEDGGLRIARTDGDGPADLSIALVVTPRDEDAVVEQDGARVFLDPDAANLLDDKVLDAEVDADGSVRFVTTLQ